MDLFFKIVQIILFQCPSSGPTSPAILTFKHIIDTESREKALCCVRRGLAVWLSPIAQPATFPITADAETDRAGLVYELSYTVSPFWAHH